MKKKKNRIITIIFIIDTKAAMYSLNNYSQDQRIGRLIGSLLFLRNSSNRNLPHTWDSTRILGVLQTHSFYYLYQAITLLATLNLPVIPLLRQLISLHRIHHLTNPCTWTQASKQGMNSCSILKITISTHYFLISLKAIKVSKKRIGKMLI